MRSSSTVRRAVCAMGVLLVGTAWVSAADQPNDRRERFEPLLMIETGARMGECDALTFTPDGKYLLAAGDDRVVHVWTVSARGLEAQPPLRWSIWKERRGAIYGLALDPSGEHVALAGLGVRNGSVVVLDRRTGKVVHALTDVKGNSQVVWRLAFAPSGTTLVFGTEDGSVWSWNLRAGRANDVRRLGGHRPRDKSNRVRLLAFRDATRVLSVAQDGEVLEWDLARPGAQPRAEFEFRVGTVYRAVLSPDGRRLAAAGERRGPGVEVVGLDDGGRQLLTLEGDDLPHSLAFDADGTRLAVGVRTVPANAAFFKEVDDKILVFDLSQRPPRPAAGPAVTFHPDALAFHPDGTRLAVAGGADHEVTLWDLARPGDRPLAQARGPGRCLWQVGLSADGRYVGYKDQREPDPPHLNQRARGPWTRVFDLRERAWASRDRFRPEGPVNELGGWRVVPSADPYVWHVEGPGGRHVLPLDEAYDGVPRCYTFLRGPDGGVRLAVGHYWGVSVFALGAAGPHRVRLLSGHQDYVTSVVPSADHTTLVTASRDQTLAFWSLADWPHQAELGAAFDVRTGRLYVDAVEPGSPAWEAGLSVGDQVVGFAFNSRRVDGKPGAWKARLDDPVPGLEHYFEVRHVDGTPGAFQTTVRQAPALRLFPTRDGEWVLWRQFDGYYDASAGGDRFVGWQVSGDVDQDAAFYEAEQFRHLYQRPAKVAEAISRIRFRPERARIPDDVQPPLLRLDAGPAVDAARGVTVHLEARPRGPREAHRPRRVILWVGDHRYLERDVGGDTFAEQVVIPPEHLRAGVNRLTLQCYSRAGATARTVAEVHKDGPDPRPALHVLLVGITDFSSVKLPSGMAFGPLSGIHAEVLRLRDAWDRQKPAYSQVDVTLLENEKATRGAILDYVRRLRGAKPDDLFVLFLGGHGDAEGNKPGTFAYVCWGYDRSRAADTGLASRDLYAELMRLPCRKLVLLDACHSGDVASNPVRDLAPDGVGPIILSAVQHRQEAFIDDLEGGVFVTALREALGDGFPSADQDGDGRLDPAELARYVGRRVPELWAERKARATPEELKEVAGKEQTPCFFPAPDLMERFSLARRPAAGP